MVALLVLVRRQFSDAKIWYFLLVVVLRARCQFHAHVAVQSLHIHFRSKNCLPNWNEQVTVDVVAVTLEVLVRFNFQLHYQISHYRSRVSLFSNSEVNTCVYTFWYIDDLFYSPMLCTLPPTSHASSFYYNSRTIAHSTHLLHHKRTLFNRLKASASAPAAFNWRSARSALRSFASRAHISATKWYSLLCAFDSLHEVNLQTQNNVLSFRLDRFSHRTLFPAISTRSKHLFKFFKNSLVIWLLFLLERRSLTIERILSWFSLKVLLISCDSCWVINPSLLLIPNCLVSCVNSREFVLSFRWLVDVRMILLR